jgi:membrane associated rhomboid family serine protease
VTLSDQSNPNPSEPIFNVPVAVTATVAVLVFVHAVRVLILTDAQDVEFLLTFGFIPARYSSHIALGGALPGGFAADLWTFFTYAFIHADLTHLAVNLAWLVPFASALARRFGSWRYVLFMLATAAVGAMAHLVSHLGAIEPMIGASAAISGAMAGAMRFVFQSPGRLVFFRDPAGLSHLPARPLGATLRDPRFLLFLAIWLGLNVLFGFGTIAFGATDQEIAWQAHVGGFFAGLFLFKAFDPVRSSPELTVEPSA